MGVTELKEERDCITWFVAKPRMVSDGLSVVAFTSDIPTTMSMSASADIRVFI